MWKSGRFGTFRFGSVSEMRNSSRAFLLSRKSGFCVKEVPGFDDRFTWMCVYVCRVQKAVFDDPQFNF